MCLLEEEKRVNERREEMRRGREMKGQDGMGAKEEREEVSGVEWRRREGGEEEEKMREKWTL